MPKADTLGHASERATDGIRNRVLVLCGLVAFVYGVNTQAFINIAPALAALWHLPHSELGLFFSIGPLGVMFGALGIAPLADRLGRKPVLIFCVVLFGTSTLATSSSSSVFMLDALRFLFGIGIGGATPNLIAIATESAPKERRSLLVVIIVNSIILGSIVGGLLSAKLVPALGWTFVPAAAGAAALLLVPALIAGLPETPYFLVLRARGGTRMAALFGGKRKHSSDGDASPAPVDACAPAGGVLALFRDGRSRMTLTLWLILFMSYCDFYLLISWLPTTMHALGIGLGMSIAIGTFAHIGGVTGSVFGWLLDKIGACLTLFSAYLLAAIAIAGIGLGGTHLVVVSMAAFFAGMGIMGGHAAANAVAASLYPTEIRSTGVGWAMGVGKAGAVLGPGLVGVFLSAGVSSRAVFFLAMLPALCAAAAALGLGPARRAAPFARAQTVPAKGA